MSDLAVGVLIGIGVTLASIVLGWAFVKLAAPDVALAVSRADQAVAFCWCGYCGEAASAHTVCCNCKHWTSGQFVDHANGSFDYVPNYPTPPRRRGVPVASGGR